MGSLRERGGEKKNRASRTEPEYASSQRAGREEAARV